MEDMLTINRLTFNFIHVSPVPRFWGNSAERYRFLYMLEKATFILLFVSCIAYDEFADSSDLFYSIINSRFFAHKSVILLFTKADLLEEKIKHSNIKEYFPEFQGDPRKLQDVQGFIFRMFDDRRQENSRAHFCGHHFITTNDPENITLLFDIFRNTYLCKGCIRPFKML